MCLIFVIMLILIRAFVSAAVIVGTVAFSFDASFGLTVLIWQQSARVPAALVGARNVGHRVAGRGI
ncbi:MMPL family transporter [Mycobacterium tilburgii]|uniref:MMPL family transporter n=1 Tax=Mycobacterium tilburgii TaxID=44467 RepID=UPI003898EAD0